MVSSTSTSSLNHDLPQLICMQRRLCQQYDSAETDFIADVIKDELETKIDRLMGELHLKEENIKFINEEVLANDSDHEEAANLLRDTLHDVLREAELLRANVENLKIKKVKLMGIHERQMENNLSELKVKHEVYFGIANYVGNSMHKMYKDFSEGKNTLLDGLDIIDENIFRKFSHLWSILTKLHFFFSKPHTSEEEKRDAANSAKDFTKYFPVYFPEQNITRKMHVIGFVIPELIEKDTSDNICHKFLKLEQAGERVHNIWNSLIRTRFFAIKDSNKKLLSTFLEYENLLYVDKKNFSENKS